MSIMVAEVYEAFISVGIKAEKAKAAAIALSIESKTESQEVKQEIKANFKGDIQEINGDVQEIKVFTQKIEKQIQKMDKELAVLKWMVGGIGGIILTLCITILAKLFIG